MAIFDWLKPEKSGDPAILFFDGVCGLCSKVVDFTLARDRLNQFQFAPLQGQTASSSLPAGYTADLNTFVLADVNGIHERSDAVLRVLYLLGGFWRLVSWLRVIPRPVRDFVYSQVAHVRYRVFGKYDTCRLPTPEERQRFLP